MTDLSDWQIIGVIAVIAVPVVGAIVSLAWKLSNLTTEVNNLKEQEVNNIKDKIKTEADNIKDNIKRIDDDVDYIYKLNQRESPASAEREVNIEKSSEG
jgi:predicted PurR-regulated permease PerM